MNKVEKVEFSRYDIDTACAQKLIKILKERIDSYHRKLEIPIDEIRTSAMRGMISEDRAILRMLEHDK